MEVGDMLDGKLPAFHTMLLNTVPRTRHSFTLSTIHTGNTLTCLLDQAFRYCCILAFGPGKHAIPKWCAGRKWHIPMASNRKRSRGRIKTDNMGQGEDPTVPLQSDAPEESDLWTAWQLFPLDDDQTCHSKNWWTLNYYITQSRQKSDSWSYS